MSFLLFLGSPTDYYLIDIEVKKIVDAGYQRAKKILEEKIDDLHKLAKALLIYETLSGEEIKDLIQNNTQPIVNGVVARDALNIALIIQDKINGK